MQMFALQHNQSNPGYGYPGGAVPYMSTPTASTVLPPPQPPPLSLPLASHPNSSVYLNPSVYSYLATASSQSSVPPIQSPQSIYTSTGSAIRSRTTAVSMLDGDGGVAARTPNPVPSVFGVTFYDDANVSSGGTSEGAVYADGDRGGGSGYPPTSDHRSYERDDDASTKPADVVTTSSIVVLPGSSPVTSVQLSTPPLPPPSAIKIPVSATGGDGGGSGGGGGSTAVPENIALFHKLSMSSTPEAGSELRVVASVLTAAPPANRSVV